MRKLLWLPLLGSYQVFLSGPIVLASLVDPKLGYSGVRLWEKLIMATAGAKATLEGAENLPDGPVVIMANHQSYLDVLALFDQLPYMLRFVAKKELQYVPFFGWAMKALGHILIDRGNSEQARKSLDQGARQIREGVTVAIFPEGTRSKDGELLPFKKGGFVLAIKSGVPILPVSISGGEKVLPRGALFSTPGTIKVKVHPPIDTRSYTLENKEELIQRVREVIARGVEH
jgi:1-acyl-sn-glycerol-3-phosphate acyltransferase